MENQTDLVPDETTGVGQREDGTSCTAIPQIKSIADTISVARVARDIRPNYYAANPSRY
ncbi:hypothetical protein SCLCIDRAFT_1211689 [Scleroderma citrinum Foug A]|uniref:Uncharacterized protein n=1 Tax=Scleroderma citrinum Foug A TaxID=1036808 RepID=A0A0C2ZX50_9AGAM|nr:hypothetical protein SCLCIDRAFT_1211689 [Scleroderma citrinum Foug A]